MVTGKRAARHRRVAAALTLVAVALCARAQDPSVRAPFVTTPDEVVKRMLLLAGTGPSDYVVDLGSGDGRIVIAAAREFDAQGLGVDIDSRLVELSRENARRAGVSGRAQFELRDVFATDLSRATVVTIYLLPSLIDRLQPKLLDELRPGARIVAHAFPMQGWKPDRVEKLRLSKRHEGQGDESTLFLWIVPAQARGAWHAGGLRLRIYQNFQEIEVEARSDGRMLEVTKATLEGDAIAFSGPGLSFRGRLAADQIVGELTLAGRTTPVVFGRK